MVFLMNLKWNYLLKNILDEGMKILDTVGTTGSACRVDSSVVEIQSRSTLKQESPMFKQIDNVHIV